MTMIELPICGIEDFMGCNCQIERISELYRCTDCGVAMHKSCLLAHFNGAHQPHPLREVQLIEALAAKEAELIRVRALLTPASPNREEAADTEAVREVLEPFAKWADVFEEIYGADLTDDVEVVSDGVLTLSLGHLRKARATISTLESNARVQAKLLADTGRELDQLKIFVRQVADCEFSDSLNIRRARELCATLAITGGAE